MTVDERWCNATETLILPKPRKFYPAKIPVRHWQLRSLISAAAPDKVYYACDSDVYCLHTTSRKRELVVSLTFEPRCLAAGYGWLCAGGVDQGQFAAVKLDAQQGPRHERAPRWRAEIDSSMLLDLESHLRQHQPRLSLDPETIFPGSRRRSPQVYVHELGDDIVNSVSVHQSSQDSFPGLAEVIAVLTIFSLTHNCLVQFIDCPFQMNHASISPIGNLLVAVGDGSTMFFYRRDKRSSTSTHWEKCSEYSPAPKLVSQNDSYFSTAFSPSGRYCAVASQGGIIIVFDVRTIEQGEANAIHAVIPSSAPNTSSGAIRSMCFAPEPWELLICTEHSGRVSVVDARNGFRSRQVIHLKCTGDTERLDVSDAAPAEDLIDPRLRDRSDSDFTRRYSRAVGDQDEPLTAQFAPGFEEAVSERYRRERQAVRDGSPLPFTERERQILEALRSSRERNEAREPPRPISINYFEDAPPYPLGSLNPVADTAHSISSSIGGLSGRGDLSRSFPSPLTQGSVPSLRDYIRDRNMDRYRSRLSDYESRGRGSSLQAAEGAADRSSALGLPDAPSEPQRRTPNLHGSAAGSHATVGPASGDLIDSNRETAPSELDSGQVRPSSGGSPTILGQRSSMVSDPERIGGRAAAPSGLEQDTDHTSTDHWHTYQTAMAVPHSVDARARNSYSQEIERASSMTDRQLMLMRMERDRRRRLRQYMGTGSDGDRIGRGNGEPSPRYDAEAGTGTAGCAMSEDGRKLYVATEEGIFELHVNLVNRRSFPQITPR
ncbi:MAG: hypothetical protein M1817_006213 [Caeruleum heppii]|nr:MAG: hypothetical protein M1817_006213 [Caeruleum heppii]